MPRLAALVLVLLLTGAARAQAPGVPANPLIDFATFARAVGEVGELRERRRLTEEEFARMAAEPGTVVLDARSERLYRLRHVAGAVNLAFPEFTAATLARIIPSPETRVLIYCNNNFMGAPESMPVKAFSAALNLSTFVSLHSYGYRNVYELGPAVDVRRSSLAFAGSESS
jgi:phage shock protein E